MIAFAPPVPGAPQHMLGLQLAREAGVAFTVVPYRANAQSMQDLLGARVDCGMNHMAEFAPHAREARVRLLAVSSEARLAGLPEVPTFAQQGFPTLTASEAYCVVLPARTPVPFVAALHAAVAAAVADPVLRERLARLEVAPMVLSPEATGARLRAELAAWAPIVRDSGFRPEE